MSRLCILQLVTALVIGLTGTALAESKSPPNVVIILADDKYD